MSTSVVSDYNKDILQGADATSNWAMYLELQSKSTIITKHMILLNSLVDQEVLKLKKALEAIEKEKDHAIEANIKLITCHTLISSGDYCLLIF